MRCFLEEQKRSDAVPLSAFAGELGAVWAILYKSWRVRHRCGAIAPTAPQLLYVILTQCCGDCVRYMYIVHIYGHSYDEREYVCIVNSVTHVICQ